MNREKEKIMLEGLLALNKVCRDSTDKKRFPRVYQEYDWNIRRLQEQYALKFSKQEHYYGA